MQTEQDHPSASPSFPDRSHRIRPKDLPRQSYLPGSNQHTTAVVCSLPAAALPPQATYYRCSAPLLSRPLLPPQPGAPRPPTPCHRPAARRRVESCPCHSAREATRTPPETAASHPLLPPRVRAKRPVASKKKNPPQPCAPRPRRSARCRPATTPHRPPTRNGAGERRTACREKCRRHAAAASLRSRQVAPYRSRRARHLAPRRCPCHVGSERPGRPSPRHPHPRCQMAATRVSLQMFSLKVEENIYSEPLAARLMDSRN